MKNSDAGKARFMFAAHRLPLLIALPIASVILAVLLSTNPLLALAAVCAAPLVYLVLSHPDHATLLAIFVVYTNAAVVAVNFHGIPFVIGAAVAPLLLSFAIAYHVVFRKEKLVFTPVLSLVCLLLLVQMVSTAFSDRPDAATETMIGYVTEGLLLYFLVTNAVRTPQMLQRAIWTLMIAGALMGGLSLYQQVTRTYDNNYGGFAQNENNAAFRTRIGGREAFQPSLEGPLGKKNYYAHFMLMLLPLAVITAVSERRRLMKLLAAATVPLIVAGIALTFSRAAALGGALMIVIMMLLRYIKVHHFAGLCLGVAVLFLMLPQYSTRLQSFERIWGAADAQGAGFQSADSSTQGRLTEMASAGMAFLDHPLLGLGPGVFKYHYTEYADRVGLRVLATTREAHNVYLQIAAESGVFGILSFLAILFVTLVELLRTRALCLNNHPEIANMASGFFVMLILYAAMAMFANFSYVRYFWLMLALANAAAFIGRKTYSLTGECSDSIAQMPSPSAGSL